MKNLKKTLLLVVAAATIFSCQKEAISEATPEVQNQELSKVAKETRDYLLSEGFKEKDIKVDNANKQFIVSGDMRFPYEFYGNIKDKLQNKNQVSTNLVTYANSNSVTYYIETNVHANYVNAMDWAGYAWSFSSNNINFTRTFTKSGADIVVGYRDFGFKSPGVLDPATGEAAMPPGGTGNVGNFININTRWLYTGATSGTTAAINKNKELRAILLHEIGHTLGYGHSNENWGTNIPNTHTPAWHNTPANYCASVMNSGISFLCCYNYSSSTGWTADDKIALAYRYTVNY
jgi:Matrixin